MLVLNSVSNHVALSFFKAITKLSIPENVNNKRLLDLATNIKIVLHPRTTSKELKYFLDCSMNHGTFESLANTLVPQINVFDSSFLFDILTNNSFDLDSVYQMREYGDNKKLQEMQISMIKSEYPHIEIIEESYKNEVILDEAMCDRIVNNIKGSVLSC